MLHLRTTLVIVSWLGLFNLQSPSLESTCKDCMAKTSRKRGPSPKSEQRKFKSTLLDYYGGRGCIYKCAPCLQTHGTSVYFWRDCPPTRQMYATCTKYVYRYMRRRMVRFTWKAEGCSMASPPNIALIAISTTTLVVKDVQHNDCSKGANAPLQKVRPVKGRLIPLSVMFRGLQTNETRQDEARRSEAK
ncbi:hypothetical protein GGI43DRAFT_252585 [Trichoderma evansii]